MGADHPGREYPAGLTALRPWVAALSSTLLMQSVASYLSQTLPVVAPLLTGGSGLSPESIGTLNGIVAFGTVLFLIFGGPLLVRWGPVRTLQAGAVCSGLGLVAAALGGVPALVVASLLLGIGYGPSPPAGSRILAATAPAGHRTLIFSVKQAGAPLGGALAGLMAAPVAAAFGAPAALLLGLLIAVVCSCIIQPLRTTLDAERDAARPIHLRALFGRANLAAPFAALRMDPLLPPLTLLALSFAVVQGVLFTFTVTWLVREHGLTLVAAGTAFAAMQGAGVVARIILGWIADRTGRASRNLLLQSFAAAASLAAFALMPLGSAMIIPLAALNGFLGASWNGITMAEVARVSPPGRVADATAGSTMFIFLGYVAGPAGFAALVPWIGWQACLLLAAAQLAVVAAGITLRRIAT